MVRRANGQNAIGRFVVTCPRFVGDGDLGTRTRMQNSVLLCFEHKTQRNQSCLHTLFHRPPKYNFGHFQKYILAWLWSLPKASCFHTWNLFLFLNSHKVPNNFPPSSTDTNTHMEPIFTKILCALALLFLHKTNNISFP